MMITRAVLTLAVSLLTVTLSAFAAEEEYILQSWDEGLGDVEYSRLAFRFEVSFMKIDVADIEARLTPTEAASLGALVRQGKATRSLIDQAATVVLKADTVAFRFTFLRDGGLDRFLEGTRKNLERARKAGVISEAEYVSVWEGFRRTMKAVEERGARRGDQLLYRIQKDGVRMIFLGTEGHLLFDTTHTGEGWTRGIKGSFLARDSNYREKLIRSLWDD